MDMKKLWDDPIIGFASADDLIFMEIRKEIGNFHWTPLEAWRTAYPDSELHAKDISVVSAVFPQTEETKRMQREEDLYPCKNWVLSRHYWDTFAQNVSERFIENMKAQGITAIAPVFLPEFSRVESKKHNYSSKWSERHTAYACGLGTFGYSEGLITPVGKAMRALSFIIDKKVEPTPRPYSSYNEYCLYYREGTCKQCVRRCPSGSLTDLGHDKDICEKYAYDYSPETKMRYGIPNNSCGLCQTGVPCESGIPNYTSSK